MSILQAVIKNIKSKQRKKKSDLGEIKKEFLKAYLPENPKILEAGAHIGRDTVQLADLWPEGRVYAFEPVARIFHQLIENTQSFPNVNCFQFALSDKNGETEIFISSGASDASSSLRKPQDHLTFHPDVQFQAAEVVKTITIDDWAASNKVERIDFLWLDLQGMEFNVLKASPNILKTVQAIYTEVNLIPLYEGTQLYPEFKHWLIDQGYKVVKEFIPWKDAGNVLFVRAN